jgi:hypothetical protein
MLMTVTFCRNAIFGCPEKNPFTNSEIRPLFCKPSGGKNFEVVLVGITFCQTDPSKILPCGRQRDASKNNP